MSVSRESNWILTLTSGFFQFKIENICLFRLIKKHGNVFENWLCPNFLLLPKKIWVAQNLGGLQPPSPPRPVRLCLLASGASIVWRRSRERSSSRAIWNPTKDFFESLLALSINWFLSQFFHCNCQGATDRLSLCWWCETATGGDFLPPFSSCGWEKDQQNLSHSKNKVIRSFFLLTGTGKGLMVELGNKSLKSKILTVIYKIN